METLRWPHPTIYHVTCDNEACNAFLRCQKDELQFNWITSEYPDWSFECPHCKRRTTVDLEKSAVRRDGFAGYSEERAR